VGIISVAREGSMGSDSVIEFKSTIPQICQNPQPHTFGKREWLGVPWRALVSDWPSSPWSHNSKLTLNVEIQHNKFDIHGCFA
jgi:hypothetical protein